MDEGEFMRHLVEHQDQQVLVIKSSSSCVWLHYGDILRSRGHLTLRQKHADITSILGSLLDINFIAAIFT
jgi:hypothetical protein